MVNLGAVSTNASASDLLARDSMEGGAGGSGAVRPTLIVREEGKAPTHFVSAVYIYTQTRAPARIYIVARSFLYLRDAFLFSSPRGSVF